MVFYGSSMSKRTSDISISFRCKNSNLISSKRAISAKAKLIILHDFRLFTPLHHYIWKRFVNVIFVRRHETTSTKPNTTEFYELSTVPYPIPINEIFVSKHLDFWRNGRFRKGAQLIEDRTKNLAGKFCS